MKKEIKEGVNRKRNAGNTFVATQISISVISPSYIANNFHFLFISQCLLCHQRYITKLFCSQFTFQKKGVKIIAIGVGNYEEFEGQLEEIAGEDVYTVNCLICLLGFWKQHAVSCVAVICKFLKECIRGKCTIKRFQSLSKQLSAEITSSKTMRCFFAYPT